MAPTTLLLLPLLTPSPALPSPGLPLVVNTWANNFTRATNTSYHALTSSPSTSAIDAVVAGCTYCEFHPCDTSVGFGGSPDESCETTLDALLFDGNAMDSGAVAGLRRVKNAIGVARGVLERTRHSLLVGDAATGFAVGMGFEEEGLGTGESERVCEEWRRGGCQPNYRVRVEPDPGSSCGPYKPLPDHLDSRSASPWSSSDKDRGHDTLSLIAIHADGSIAAGTTTNGATHKIPGRVGDGPIAGSGSYADSTVGACGATGDGDIMMRFLPCYQAVENLRLGMSVQDAAQDAVRRMRMRVKGNFEAAIVVVSKEGEHAGAATGWEFEYSFRGGDMEDVEVVKVLPLEDGRARLEL